jgi:hypothetical protein
LFATIPTVIGDASRAPAAQGAEYGTVATLVPRVAAASVLILLGGTFATNNDVTGDFNHAMYFAMLAVAAVITVAFVRNHQPTRFDVALAVVASCGLVLGIEAIERPQTIGYWEGFGNVVALGTVILVLLLATVVRTARFPTWARLTLALVVTACSAFDLLGSVRTAGYFPIVGNNLNQVNDMLGPVAGRIPDVTFIPEYTALYGWLLVPFKSLLSPLGLVAAVAIILTVLGFAALALAAWVVGRMFVSYRFALALGFVVPITLVTSRLVGDSSSITGISQELAIRLFAGFLIGAIGLNDLVLLYRGSIRPGHLLLIGVVCGVVSWNSQDFGLAATGVYGLMILCGAASSTRVRAAAMWLVGLLAGIASYPLFLIATGSRLNLDYVGFFVRSAGSLGPAAIQVPGPVLIVAPIIICSAAAGWALMRIRHRESSREDPLLDRATITLAFVGSWGVIGLLYYANRAYAAGQLQTLLLICGVCIAGMLAVALRTDEFKALWRPRAESTMWAWWSRKAMLLPLGIVVCLPFAATWLTTNPIRAAQLLVNHPATDSYTGYDIPQIVAAVDTAQRFTSKQGGALNYLGESFNYVSLVTHVPSATLLFGFPFSTQVSAVQVQAHVTQIQCRYLTEQQNKPTWLVLSLNGLTGYGDSVCGLYQTVDIPGLVHGQLQELK